MLNKGSLNMLDLNPKLTALVIIDMENEFCKPGGIL
jgi:hypothetical protein